MESLTKKIYLIVWKNFENWLILYQQNLVHPRIKEHKWFMIRHRRRPRVSLYFLRRGIKKAISSYTTIQ